jgi:hypothetical protein
VQLASLLTSTKEPKMNHELIGLDPGNLKPLYTGDRAFDSGVEAVAEALRFASEASEKIGDLALTLKANKDLSPSGRLRQFREQEINLREPAFAKLNSAKALIEARIKDSDRKMSAPPPPEDEEGLRRQSNLVAAIREMTPEDRAKLCDKENLGDDELAGAILRNHHVALRMSRNEWDLFRINWQRQKFPGYADQLTRLNSALGHIERGIPILSAFAEKKANSLAGDLRVARD